MVKYSTFTLIEQPPIYSKPGVSISNDIQIYIFLTKFKCADIW